MTESAASLALKADARPASLKRHLSRTVPWRLSTSRARCAGLGSVDAGMPYISFDEILSAPPAMPLSATVSAEGLTTALQKLTIVPLLSAVQTLSLRR